MVGPEGVGWCSLNLDKELHEVCVCVCITEFGPVDHEAVLAGAAAHD